MNVGAYQTHGLPRAGFNAASMKALVSSFFDHNFFPTHSGKTRSRSQRNRYVLLLMLISGRAAAG